MGMFDWVKCSYPIPAPPWPQEDDFKAFQAKFLDGGKEHYPSLSKWEIRADGTLWKTQANWPESGDVEDLTYSEPRHVKFSGVFPFYDYADDTFGYINWNFVFKDGKLERMELCQYDPPEALRWKDRVKL